MSGSDKEIVLEFVPGKYKIVVCRADFDRDLWPEDGVGLTLKERILADDKENFGYRRYLPVLRAEGILTARDIPREPETPEPPGPPNPDPGNTEGRLTRIKKRILGR